MKIDIFLVLSLFARSIFAQDWLTLDSYEAHHLTDVYTIEQNSLADNKPGRFLRSVTSYEKLQDSDNPTKEKTDIAFNEDGSPRDKRTLGLIVQGLANALGYTLSPVQIASLPNPQPPQKPAPSAPAPKPSKAPAPAPSAKPPSPPVIPSSPATPAKAPAAPAPTQPRQRETIRITGLVNFGANANADLPGQLTRYEQLFHGTPPPAPAAAKPPVKPPAPIPTLSLPKIPSPIVPNLSPLLPPSRPPVSTPSSGLPKPKSEGAIKQEVETEYRSKEDSEKLNVESKEIEGDRDLYLELPGVKYRQEPNWQQGYNQRLKELEDRQREYSERLKQHEEKLAKSKGDHEDNDERFANREKEISERDKAHSIEIRERERERERQESEEDKPQTESEDSRKEDQENNEEPWRGYERPSSSENERENGNRYEYEDERNPEQYSEYDEEPKKYLDHEEEPPKQENDKNENVDALPVSRDEDVRKSNNIQNSYGESLEDNEGQIDDNIADYFIKFKDPKTGLYVPEKTQNPENYKKENEPWWKGNSDDFDGRLSHLRKEYSSLAPESKYEEYKLENEPEENVKSSEKLESNKEADDESATPQPSNNPQKNPDYSEVFGVYEPYVKNDESAESEGKVSDPSSDEEGSSQSELKQDSYSEDESEKDNEKLKEENLNEDKEIPFYNFDFKSFAPYFSPIKYIYGSDDAEPGIPRIRSYQKDSQVEAEAAEESATEVPIEMKESVQEEPVRSIIGSSAKLATKSLHDGESKEIHAWPAPFDYFFDSTEQTNVAELPRVRSTEIPREYVNDGLYLRENSQEISVQQRTRQEEDEPKNIHRYNGYREYSRPSSTLESDATKSQNSSPQKNAQELSDTRINSGETGSNHEMKAELNIQQPIENHQRYTPSEYPLRNYQHGYEINHGPNYANFLNIHGYSNPCKDERTRNECLQRYQPSESEHQINSRGPEEIPISLKGPRRHFGPKNFDLRNRGADFNQQYTPSEPRFSGRRFDENLEAHVNKQDQVAASPDPEDKSSLKFEDPKSAHDFFGFSQNDYDFDNTKNVNDPSEKLNKKESQSINDEVLDLLVVSEPTPYQYDEKLTEFTVEPESDTEKVKVKEYRNKVATVTVSERKQLSPEGPVHLIGYMHQY